MYAEHFIEVNRKPCEPFLDIKAAGMSKNAKDMFINGKYKISDLKAGLELKECNLKAVRIKGGILLTNKDFCIRESKDKKINVVKSVDKKDKKWYTNIVIKIIKKGETEWLLEHLKDLM